MRSLRLCPVRCWRLESPTVISAITRPLSSSTSTLCSSDDPGIDHSAFQSDHMYGCTQIQARMVRLRSLGKMNGIGSGRPLGKMVIFDVTGGGKDFQR